MLLKASFVLNFYKMLLWIITVVSSMIIGRLWSRKTDAEQINDAYLVRATVEAEVASKSDDMVKEELKKWVRRKD